MPSGSQSLPDPSLGISCPPFSSRHLIFARCHCLLSVLPFVSVRQGLGLLHGMYLHGGCTHRVEVEVQVKKLLVVKVQGQHCTFQSYNFIHCKLVVGISCTRYWDPGSGRLGACCDST